MFLSGVKRKLVFSVQKKLVINMRAIIVIHYQMFEGFFDVLFVANVI